MPTGYGGYQRPQGGDQGAGGMPAWSDPHLTMGGDYHTIDLPNGETLELCPQCYKAVVAAVLSDLQAVVDRQTSYDGMHRKGGGPNPVR